MQTSLTLPAAARGLLASLAVAGLCLAGCTSTGGGAPAARAADAPPHPRSLPYAVIDGEPAPVPDVEMGDRAVVRRVIRTAQTDSRIMDHLTHFAEAIGPRLTGSTRSERAELWAAERFREWGLQNVRREKWGEIAMRFDRGESSGAVVSWEPEDRRAGAAPGEGAGEWEVERDLTFTTLSWTRGTDGPLLGRAVKVPRSWDEFEAVEDQLAGAWIVIPADYGDRRGVRSTGFLMRERTALREAIRTGEDDPFEPALAEIEEGELRWVGTVTYQGNEFPVVLTMTADESGVFTEGTMEVPSFHTGPIELVQANPEAGDIEFDWQNPLQKLRAFVAIAGDNLEGRTADNLGTIEAARDRGDVEPPAALDRTDDQILARILEKNPAGFVSPSTDERVWTTSVNGWMENTSGDLPRDIEVNVKRSDYDYINSRLADDNDVYLRFDLPHRLEDGPIACYNVIAEIPGVLYPEEAVIVSAHLDSWDGPRSQGVVDNGTGSSVVLEAARLLATSGARPDRTIRFILWTGEEQGLWGSRRYAESLTQDELDRISCVFVDDGGTNYEGGLPAADQMVDYMAAATAPINGRFYSPEDGSYMNVNVRPTGPNIQTHGGSDHASFNRRGVPGFYWDEIGRANYRYAWHTQNDRLDQAIPEYLAQSSATMAVTAYNIACAPEILARAIPEDETEETASR